MSKRYATVSETIEYNTAQDSTNNDERNLVAGSRNVIIDQQRKVRTRNGNTRLGVANSALTPTRNGTTWNTSTSTELMLRAYDDELEVYLTTVDGTALNAFYRVAQGFSTTEKPRFTTWYSDTEKLDLLVFVYGNANTYAWSGAVCVVDSVTATTITKTGTDTFGQARFFTAGNKVLVNTRTGTEYTYTGGENTTILTGIADTTDITAGDVLVQKIITNSNSPAANRNNHTVYTFENQLCVASDDDQLVYVSKNNSYTTFTYSSPRLPGEGALLTLDDPAKGFGTLEEKLIIFAGRSSVYQVTPREITVGSTLSETLDVTKFQTGLGESAQSQEVIAQVNSTLVYLTHEPAVRELFSTSELQGGGKPRTLSNPIKPDMDAEDWTNATARWHKNAFWLSAPENGHVYILEYREDADGKLRRFWQAPQTMFIGAWVTLGDVLYGHSSVVPETYKIMDSEAFSDVNSSDDKMPIFCVAKFAYRNFGDRARLKNFDEYFIEGEISPSTDITHTMYYDFGGNTQSIETTIRGTNEDILEETLSNVALGQQPLGYNPLGGSLSAPEGSAKFRVIIELAKEDFFEMQEIFQSDDTDKYWSVIARGTNAQMSSRQPVNKKF